VVDRETFSRSLWPDKRIVLFEVSIAAVIRELRRALGDDPKSPRFIETLPRRGYRFIASVERIMSPHEAGPSVQVPTSRQQRRESWLSGGRILAIVSLLLVFNGSVSIEARRSPQAASDTTPSLRVEPFVAPAEVEATRVVRQIVDEELSAYLASALPPGFRIVAAESEAPAETDSSAIRIAGSVRMDGKLLTVSVRGVSSEDDRRLWGARYRLNAEDPFLAGREAAARIAAAILAELAPGLLDRKTVPPSAQALEFHRQAVERLQRMAETETDAAAGLFRRAIAIAPEFADAHAGLANALIGWPGPPITEERVQSARAAAERALQLAPDHALASRVLGDIHLFHDRDWTRAGERLYRAVQLDPADAGARHSLASWMSARGLDREALQEIELARALDPASIAISIDVMSFHYYARDFPGTLEASRRLATLWPENFASARYSLLSYLAMGDTDSALDIARAELARWRSTPGEGPQAPAPHGLDELDLYWAATARSLKDPAIAARVDPVLNAMVHARLGELPEALALLQSAAEEPYFSYLIPYLGVTPALDPLRGNLQFERLLRSLRQSGLSVATGES
jgi:tetratricopeptide (TPR) repeat protein